MKRRVTSHTRVLPASRRLEAPAATDSGSLRGWGSRHEGDAGLSPCRLPEIGKGKSLKPEQTQGNCQRRWLGRKQLGGTRGQPSPRGLHTDPVGRPPSETSLLPRSPGGVPGVALSPRLGTALCLLSGPQQETSG